MAEKGKTAWIYTRIDAPDDELGLLKAQERELTAYADAIGLDVVGASSDQGNNELKYGIGLTRALIAAQNGEFSILLIKSIRHLGNKKNMVIDIMKEFEQHGVRFLTPMNGRGAAATVESVAHSGMRGERHA